MHGELKHESVEAARVNLETRTLAKIEGEVARLIYLSSMRDYNTGEYHHEGLASQFTESVAQRAMASCHREAFKRLVLCSVEELVTELQTYIRSNGFSFPEFLRVWERLQPYTVTVPLECSSLSSRFFALNIRAALTILEARRLRLPPGPLSSSQGQ